jgi:phospholipase C
MSEQRPTISRRALIKRAGAGAGALALASSPGFASATPEAATPMADRPIEKINHVIVIFQENWSFDGLYGTFPGANGIANAGAAANQVDLNGVPYETLPQPIDTSVNPPAPDERFPADLPVGPFNAGNYVPADELTGDAIHRFYQEQYQINGGKMDKFVAWSDSAGFAMSYYDATAMPQGLLAQQFTLLDNIFHAAFGGSFLGAQWLISAATPVWPDAPKKMIAVVDENGIMVTDGVVTPDGYAVNDCFPIKGPSPKSITDPAMLLPLQTNPTIGDRLDEAGVSWAWYAGGWDDAVAGNPAPSFQFHHQAFTYYENYALGTPGQKAHLKDEKDFIAALQAGDLPAVSFVKAIGDDNEHPGYSTLTTGQDWTAKMVSAVQESSAWDDCAIFIAYDENGGRWDHVAPPRVDRWGPGSRVPGIVISPYAKKGFVDHTPYDTTSILKFIETRWNLEPLTTRDAASYDMTNAFDFRAPSEAAVPTVTPTATPEASPAISPEATPVS